ncbi:hypothetical protein FA15DRAFT_674582 [Coprinopsis marcescibilis]|uniref:F-box domain-containing protein n=1 Tax=Coprinopsis marcescibilis TaxID=230819 RepID=A0A5C3KHC7_COPMA|nr:hypothetical protein FA15DRAFT_674582 [Coprinopsis marcescibilis]
MSSSSLLEVSKSVVNPQLLPFLAKNDPVPDHLSPSVMDAIEEISTLTIALDDPNTNTALPQSEEIKRLRGAMHRERAMFSALKSPIREVPSEIVAIIIELALFSDRGMLDADGRADFRSLRAVSRQWRETAFATRSLWARLKVELDSPTEGPAFNWPGRLSRWFDRAGKGAPLGIELLGWGRRMDLDKLFAFILDPRWSWSEMYLGRDLVETLSRRHWSYTFTILNLQSLGWDRSGPNKDGLGYEFNFPNIRSVAIAAPANGVIDINRTLFPYPSLQSLHLSNCQYRSDDVAFSTILRQLPSLEELILEDVKPSPTGSRWFNRRPASPLRYVDFEHKYMKRMVFIGPFDYFLTFSHVTFPSLELIRICRAKETALSAVLRGILPAAGPSFSEKGVLSLEDSGMRHMDIAAALSSESHPQKIKRVHVRSPRFLGCFASSYTRASLSVETIVCANSPTEWISSYSKASDDDLDNPFPQDLKIYAPLARDDTEQGGGTVEEPLSYAGVPVESVKSWVIEEMLSYGIKGHKYAQHPAQVDVSDSCSENEDFSEESEGLSSEE